MPLMNYTTSISVEKTVIEIQTRLARNGARAINIDYDPNGAPMALAFQIETKLGLMAYRLPADIEAVHRVLTQQHASGRVPRRFVTKEQAARVGWRILKDWLDAQLALLETRMASLDAIMLPWMIAGQHGETFYQLFESKQLALPAASNR